MVRKAALFCAILTVMTTLAGRVQAMTLKEALIRARENIPSYQAARKKVAAADAAYKASFGAYLPSLDASVQTERNFQSGGDYSTKGYGATLSYNLYDPRRSPKRDIAGLNLETSKEELKKNLLELDYRVKVAFFTALAQKEILAQNRIQFTDAEKDYEVAEGRRKLGAARLSEALQASVRREQARFNVVQAEGDLNKALSELLSLIGIPYENGAITVLPEGELPSDKPLPELKSLNDAVLTRPEIRQMEIALKTAQKNLSLSWADFYPTLSASLSYNRSDAGIPGISMIENKSVGATATWNIFELGKFYRKQSAAIEVGVSEENIKEMKRGLLLDCRKGWEDLSTAVKNSTVAGEQLRQANQNYEQAFGEYKAGAGDILSLVQAESVLAGARVQLVSAQLNVALAWALLERISGKDL